MVYPREVLNRIRWTEGGSLGDATVWYTHRGAPGDYLRTSGREIRSLGRGFFEIDGASIPYHRILRIDYRGETLFEKDLRAKGLK
jgi:hypothetical protein